MDKQSVEIVIEEFEDKGRHIPAEVVRGLMEECEQLQKENAELKRKLERANNVLQNDYNWLMKICQSDVWKEALELSETKRELSDTLELLKELEG